MTEKILLGIGVSEGIKIGKAKLYYKPSNNKEFGDITEEEIPLELQRLKAAKEKCINNIDSLIEKAQQSLGTEKAVVLKGQKSFLSDPSFYPEMEKLISKKMFSAEKAVLKIVEQFAAIFEKMDNAYMRERAADIKDVGSQMMNGLSGENGIDLEKINEEVILIAEDLAPSDTIKLNKSYILAFITKIGGKTSHTAIFAKSLGIPAIVGAGEELLSVKDGDMLIVDGHEGLCIMNPEKATIEKYLDKIDAENKKNSILKEFALKDAITVDGHRVEVAANIGSEKDAAYAIEQGAESIGLLRTELIYMSQKNMPEEETLFQAYKNIVETMGERTVIIRTMDIGGDKELSYLKIPKEMNPFLGYRAIRICLDQKQLFITQLRAILRASAYGKIKIMFPMISSLEELRAAKEILHEVKDKLNDEGAEFDKEIQVGMMIEVPSAAIMAEQFAKEVDFFSIGTNDLVQYTLAVDRMNEKVAYLYNHFNPAIINIINHVVRAAHKHNKFVGMCGGMAGDPVAIPLLVGMGLDELSMSSPSIQKSRYIIRKLDFKKCESLANEVLNLSSTQEIQSTLNDFYKNAMEE